jgi:hypothetical protein
MLLGSNTNVRHRGVLFHVQTEDSGVQRPHVITHLYHGGTILASEKRSYADWLETADCEARVRALMDEQHQSMLGRLRRGELDELLRERLGDAVFSDPADTTAPRREATLTPPAPPRSAPAAPPPPERPAERTVTAPAPRPFGEGVVSNRPLDEVILAYLVEKARQRKRARS